MSKTTKKADKKPVRPQYKLPTKYINAVFLIAISFITFWLMAISGGNYLHKIESLSIFLPTHDYFRECMRLPGGILIWASTYFTQSFYYPWVGAVTYIALILASIFLAYKAFKIKPQSFPILMILPAAILLALLNLGYVIFSLKTPGYAFLLPLGLIFAISYFWCFRAIRYWWIRLIITIIGIFGYIYFGFYSLLAVGLCLIYEALTVFIHKSSWWQSLIIILIGVLSIIIFPKMWVMNVDNDLPLTFMYTWPIPRFYEGEGSLWMPYNVIIAFLILLTVFAAINKPVIKSRAETLISSAIGILAVISIFAFKYNDKNFNLTLSLDCDLWNQDWTQAIESIKDFKEEPTRLNTILSDIAMVRSHRAPEEIFTIPIGAAPYTTARSMRVPHDAGSMMFSYQTGLINYAYRWAMEYKVEYGMNVEQLKFMTKCALLNGDYDVARKCLDNLSLTIHHKDWAKKYLALVDDPSLIDQDPELSAIRPLIIDKDVFIEDKGQLEGYVWRTLANVETGGEDLLELSLVSALISREIDSFAERLPFYARLHECLPRHFQEGILIWSMVHENDGFRHYKLDPNIVDRFKRFIKAQKQIENLSFEEQREMMRPTYGDTYWFYALYLRDQQVI